MYEEIIPINYRFNSSEIENIWYIFLCLSDSTFSLVDLSYGEKGSFMISGEIMTSICKTLENIDFCYCRGAYSDAYTLTRKVRDDLMQYLFLLNVIQHRHGLTDEEAEKFTMNQESMMKMVELDLAICSSGERKTHAELAVEKWIYNELENSENAKDKKQYFDNRNINREFEQHEFSYNTKIKNKCITIELENVDSLYSQFINDNNLSLEEIIDKKLTLEKIQ